MRHLERLGQRLEASALADQRTTERVYRISMMLLDAPPEALDRVEQALWAMSAKRRGDPPLSR